jgi:hypothetical protein
MTPAAHPPCSDRVPAWGAIISTRTAERHRRSVCRALLPGNKACELAWCYLSQRWIRQYQDHVPSKWPARLTAPESVVWWAVLTDLLTTVLDTRGRAWNEESGEQGGSDPVDGTGRV